MTQDTVLIAALSGRALAASARRAGYLPLVVDAFGDADMQASAGALRCLAHVTRDGFRARPLLAALHSLAGEAPRRPIGLVLGSGFEDTPKLVATLGRHFPLIGNGAEAIARAKDPTCFFPLLDALAIPHPETRPTPPQDPQGWLSKRIGGSGGAHVVACPLARSTRGRYFQRRLQGEPVSDAGRCRAPRRRHRGPQPPVERRRRAQPLPLRRRRRAHPARRGDRGTHDHRGRGRLRRPWPRRTRLLRLPAGGRRRAPARGQSAAQRHARPFR